MSEENGYMKALKCRECGREYPLTANHVCEFDFGPLEVAYDYDLIRNSLNREVISRRPNSMWRYRELLPVAKEPTVGLQVGYTPLVKADRLAKRLGIRELWIKNDTVNYPTLSFKDRVVSVALSRSAPGAAKFEEPCELSSRVESSSESIKVSATKKPTL